MQLRSGLKKLELLLFVAIFLLTVISTIVLHSIEPSLYPAYFVYLIIGLVIFVFFLNIDFEILTAFSAYTYILSILFLILPLIIGRVTRGAVRWIVLGNLSIQPSEVVRPFILLHLSKYLTKEEISPLRLIKLFILFFIPLFLILVQPSLGVAILTTFGFLGLLSASSIKKKYFLIGVGLLISIFPLLWFILAPYQKERINNFVNPANDPLGAGYNSIQSMISVGSGRFFGRGLGEGVQTQLLFLPEEYTDFIFAAISEEMGFLGSFLTLMCLFTILWVLIKIIEESKSLTGRSFSTAVFFVLFAEITIHVGMNMGLLPITGIPLPLVSAGGSALIGTLISFAITLKARK